MAARVFEVPLHRITDNPFQPRSHYDEAALEELADSITKEGLLQPPKGRLVNKEGLITSEITNMLRLVQTQEAFLGLLEDNPSWMIQLQSGHRRKRAFERAQRGSFFEDDSLFPIHLEQAEDKDMAIRAYVENDPRLREELSSVDEALFMQRLIDEFSWTQALVAEQLGLQRPTVSNKLRLLKLPSEVLTHVRGGTLSERQAQALIPIFDLSEEEQDVMHYVGSIGRDGHAIRYEIMHDAIAGESSESIRERAQRLKGELNEKAEIARDIPPVLYVETIEDLIDHSHAGIQYSTPRQEEPHRISSYLELSGGVIQDGRTVRFLVTGGFHSAEGSQINGFEIIDEWEALDRDVYSPDTLNPGSQPQSSEAFGKFVETVHHQHFRLMHPLVLRGAPEGDSAKAHPTKVSRMAVITFEETEGEAGEGEQIAGLREDGEAVSYVQHLNSEAEEQAEKLQDQQEGVEHDMDYFIRQLQDLSQRNLKADPPVKNGQRVLDAPILQIQMAATRYSKIAQEAEGWAQEAEKDGYPGLAERFKRLAAATTSSFKMFQSRYDQLAAKHSQQPLPASSEEESQGIHDIQPFDGASEPIDYKAAIDANRAPQSSNGFALPKPVMPGVYERIGNMTKADLTLTQERFTCQLWEQHARNWQASYLKDEMHQYVTELLRFHANLKVVYSLADEELLSLLAWMREKVSGVTGYSWGKSDGKGEASQVLHGLRDIENHDHLEGQALRTFQLDYARRMGAFYYHAYFTAMKAPLKETSAATA